MNQLTPYEQLLAQEMEQLPLPTNMESIWSNIQNGLNAENLPRASKPRPQHRGVGGHWRLLIIGAAIIGAIFLFRPHQKTSTKEKLPTTPQKQIIVPDSNNKKEPTQEQKNQKTKPAITIPLKHDSLPTLKQDSQFLIPSPVILPPADNKTNPPIIVIPPTKDSVKTNKKGRGVQLDDSDYKIISHRKDSNG